MSDSGKSAKPPPPPQPVEEEEEEGPFNLSSHPDLAIATNTNPPPPSKTNTEITTSLLLDSSKLLSPNSQQFDALLQNPPQKITNLSRPLTLSVGLNCGQRFHETKGLRKNKPPSSRGPPTCPHTAYLPTYLPTIRTYLPTHSVAFCKESRSTGFFETSRANQKKKKKRKRTSSNLINYFSYPNKQGFFLSFSTLGHLKNWRIVFQKNSKKCGSYTWKT